jgi:membrane protein involved in colicin uptake
MPWSRRAECPSCQAELHVCRLCQFYDARVEGKCREERAEQVRDRERANFCDYFKPRPGAYRAADAAKTQAAKAKVDALFGGAEAPAPSPDAARGALDTLFGGTDQKKRP